MNATFLYVTFLCLIHLFDGVRSQQPNDGNFLPETDFDYQDFQQAPRPLRPTPLRTARPRSPVIASSESNKATPVPILKQINRHNEDGSYTYGFEGADGSFKIETKLASGEVIGKYGYIDDSGKVRVVDYGANKYGFQPAGEGITIPAVNIGNDTDSTERYDDGESGQYTPRPEIKIPAFKPPKRKHPKPGPLFAQEQRSRPASTAPQYFVQEPEDAPARPDSQRPFVTPADVNSLQFLFGNELRENPPPLQYRSNDVPSQPPRKQFTQPRFEESSRDGERPFPQGLPIPAIFEGTASQFQVAPNTHELARRFPATAFDAANAPSSLKLSRAQSRSKSRPQLLLVSPIDELPQNAVRRHSNGGQEGGRSILDELIKQYAIPNGSPAINDFSFGYN